MKLQFRILLALLLSVVLIAGAGCRRQDDDDATPTPTLEVDDGGETDGSAGGDVGDETEDTGDDGEDAGDTEEVTEEEGEDGEDDVAGQPAGNPYVQLEMVPLSPGSSIPPGSTVTHTVVDGDWLLNLARCYGVTTQALRAANPGITNPNRILAGGELTVPDVGSAGPIIGPPCVQTVTVEAGDTLQVLAERYGVSVGELRRANPGPLNAGATVIVPNLTPTGGAVPQLTHDLLFNWQGDLAFWDASAAAVGRYATPADVLVRLATEPTGRWVLLQELSGEAAASQLSLVDRQANTIVALGAADLPGRVDVDPGFRPLLVAPDGTHAVHLSLEEGGGVLLTSFPTADPGARATRMVSRAAESNLLPRLFAGPDDTGFLLFDGTGVYAYDYGLEEERLLLAIDTETFTTPLALSPVAYAPAGRWLLVYSFYFEGSAMALLDTATGTLLDLPGSGSYVIGAGASWLADGRVAVFSAPETPTSAGPLVTTFTLLENEAGPALEADPAQPLPTVPGQAEPGYRLWVPSLQPAERLLVLVEGVGAGLWATSESGTQQLADVAFDLRWGVVWAPDSSGLLLLSGGQMGAPEQILYQAADGSGAVSFNGWLGSDLSGFHWVLPAP